MRKALLAPGCLAAYPVTPIVKAPFEMSEREHHDFVGIDEIHEPVGKALYAAGSIHIRNLRPRLWKLFHQRNRIRNFEQEMAAQPRRALFVKRKRFIKLKLSGE